MLSIATLLAIATTGILAGIITQDEIESGIPTQDTIFGGGPEITDLCLDCICNAASECQPLNCTYEYPTYACGPFLITRGFWIDGGNYTINDEHPTSFGAFERCVTDPVCARQTVRDYMQRYSRDCDGDGKITCLDYARIHRLGPISCEEDIYKTYAANVTEKCNEIGVVEEGNEL